MDFNQFETVPQLEVDNKKILTVILAADNNFAPYAGVTICSLLENASREYFYDIVILDDSISRENKKSLLQIEANYEHSKLRLIDVSHIIPDAPVREQSHFTKTTYMRLFIPIMFKAYKRVLYLDCDTIILKDISTFFNTAMNNEYIAAVNDTTVVQLLHNKFSFKFKGKKIKMEKYWNKHLNFNNEVIDKYINSGVILFNISTFTNENFKVFNDIESYINSGYLLLDQCIINILFRGRIKYMHQRWNLQLLKTPDEYLTQTTLQQLNEAENAPSIIHFITNKKPWSTIGVHHENIFWKYCRKTPFFKIGQEQLLTTGFIRWLRRSEVNYQSAPNPKPEISIIIPFYDRLKSIKKTLKSILLQNFTNFEIIIVDDFSEMKIFESLKEYVNIDARINVIRMPSNQKAGPARNTGIMAAKGKYILFCDSDDFYPPNIFNALINKANSGNFDIIAGNVAAWHSEKKYMSMPGNGIYIEKETTGSNILDFPTLWTPLHYQRIMFNKQFLDNNDIKFPDIWRCEDIFFMTEVMTKVKNIALIKDPVYLFNVRHRNYEFDFDIIKNACLSYKFVSETLTQNNLETIAFVYHSYYSALKYKYDHFSDKQLRELAKIILDEYQKIDFDFFKSDVMKKLKLDLHSSHSELILMKNIDLKTMVNFIRNGVFDNLRIQEVHRKQRLIKKIRNRYESTKRELNKNSNSISWKITRPLRAVKMLVTDNRNFRKKLAQKSKVKKV